MVEWIKAKYCEEKFRSRESYLAKAAREETSSDTGSDDGWMVKKQDSQSTKPTSPVKPPQKIVISPRRVRESFYIPDGWVQDTEPPDVVGGQPVSPRHNGDYSGSKNNPLHGAGETNGHRVSHTCEDSDQVYSEGSEADSSENHSGIETGGAHTGEEQSGRGGPTSDGSGGGNGSTAATRDQPLDHLELDRAQKRLIKNRNKKKTSSGHKSWESLLKPLQTQKERIEEIQRNNSLSEDKEQRRIIKKNLQDIKRAKKSKDEGAKSWKSLLENLEEDKTKPKSTKQGHYHGTGHDPEKKDGVAFLNDGGAAGDSKKGAPSPAERMQPISRDSVVVLCVPPLFRSANPRE